MVAEVNDEMDNEPSEEEVDEMLADQETISIVFRVEATREQLKALGEYMRNNIQVWETLK